MLLVQSKAFAKTLYVGGGKQFSTIKSALALCKNGDTIIVTKGIYNEGNIIIDKSICMLGMSMPVLDGEKKYEVLSIKSSGVIINGFRIQNSGEGTLNDPCGVKVYNSDNVRIENNELHDNFFGIYIQYGQGCVVKNNLIRASQTSQQLSGNGIHCWKSSNLQIIGNKISGHRDGIYFEFVTHSVIWRNTAKNNLRYGLHFMFSHNDAYFTNYFKNNGAGVAVMFTNHVVMANNTFEENWGDAAYGLLLKEISDCHLSGNTFIRNTTGVFFDGTNRILVEKNVLKANGWGMRLQANCMENTISHNNFLANTFDVSTNGSLTLNHFNENYWDKYEGYDLDKDKIGDVPYHPLSIYSVIIERDPPAMLLFRSFMINLLDKSEKLLPSLTPENFVDNKPLMKPLLL
ncbi:nitrous oxide reductase family maturation protein NosD [Solitalea lacus]|uniref:nitrous oxide reductase family maturation protein NosD n=1 Tax=Solitalea lacus TaxID=2911172 RepID=UPI001EDA2326|nr:nitrous oxide reductase family maturation protein NosD [Solitalea lacus]UKJ07968.1 nitrous oxide reductase family maturation protein NosD [Solitalea lacus]